MFFREEIEIRFADGFGRIDQPEPSRRVVLAWRKSFTRRAAIDAVRNAVQACKLHGVQMLKDEAAADAEA